MKIVPRRAKFLRVPIDSGDTLYLKSVILPKRDPRPTIFQWRSVLRR